MDNKALEALGLERTKNWLIQKFGSKIIHTIDTRPNKGGGKQADDFFGTDLRFKFNGEYWYVDIKASRKNYDKNIRITHQTINKLRKAGKLHRFLIAIIDSVTDKKKFSIRLFRFSDILKIDVEPHFIFKQKWVEEVFFREGGKPVEMWLRDSSSSDSRLVGLEEILNKTVLDIIEHK